jgi:hypothetical protein
MACQTKLAITRRHFLRQGSALTAVAVLCGYRRTWRPALPTAHCLLLAAHFLYRDQQVVPALALYKKSLSMGD